METRLVVNSYMTFAWLKDFDISGMSS